MIPLQNIGNTTSRAGDVACLLRPGTGKLADESPEKVMAEIWLRATEIGSVMENILREGDEREWKFEQ